MQLKKWGFSLSGIALVIFCAFKQWALNPGGPAMAVQFTFLAIVLAALVAFIHQDFWAPAAAILTTLVFYLISLSVNPPLPKVLVWMYTGLAAMGVMLYLSVNQENLKNFKNSLAGLLDQSKLKWHRNIILILIPLWAGLVVFAKTASELSAPIYPRSVHPAPPEQSDFLGKSYLLAELENPYRKLEKQDPQKFQSLVAEGKVIYYQNCFQCHGDNLDGKGHFARALNPLPANFQDPGTIAMLQESFVFWRVSKGGPGLPSSAHPWNSAMPQWENILKEDEIWKAILWIYAGAGRAPRTWEKASTEHVGH